MPLVVASLVAQTTGASRLLATASGLLALLVLGIVGVWLSYDCFNTDCGSRDQVAAYGVWVGAGGLVACGVIAVARVIRRESWGPDRVDPALISHAVLLWTGFGATSWPRRDETRVRTALGAETTQSVMPVVRALEDEFDESDVKLTAKDLTSMANRAATQFARRHPEVSAGAVAALAWCYAYDYK